MNNDRAVVEQDPVPVVTALNSKFLHSDFFESVFNLLSDVFGLDTRRGASYDEAVTDSSDFLNIKDEDIVGLAVDSRIGGVLSNLEAFQKGLLFSYNRLR